MANIWHSSTVLFLSKNELLPIIAPCLDKSSNLIDLTSFNFINDRKLQEVIRHYFTIDMNDVSDIKLYKECHGILFGTDPDSFFVYLKAKKKNYKVVVLDYSITAYKKLLEHDCITIFDVILELYNSGKLSKKNLIDIMDRIKDNTKTPSTFTTIKSYSTLTTLVH